MNKSAEQPQRADVAQRKAYEQPTLVDQGQLSRFVAQSITPPTKTAG